MPIRMTGIVSNLDTDSIIKELMNAHSVKKTKKENQITKHEWTQEKWSDLNSKIYNLYTGSLSKIRMKSSFLSKKATSSNEAKVSVKASNDAAEGSHTIKVNKLASSQYVTSAKLVARDEEGNTVVATSATKLVSGLGMEEGSTINLSTGEKSIDFDITEYSTVGDFVNACKSIGLTATFDTTQSRFFIGSASSGTDGAFSITTSKYLTPLWTAKKNVREIIGYGDYNSTARADIDQSILTYATTEDPEEEEAAYEKLLGRLTTYITSSYASELKEKYNNGDLASNDPLKIALEDAERNAREEYQNNTSNPTTEGAEKAVDSAISKVITEHLKALREEFVNAEEGADLSNNRYATEAIRFNLALNDYKTELSNSTGAGETITGELEKIGLTHITFRKNEDGSLVYDDNDLTSWRALGGALVGSADSEVEYNGATLVNSSNTFTANGLTFTVQDVTEPNETISLTVSKDTDSVYDMVKSFLKEYNGLLDELNKAYNASSARGYNPLTDEEREAMTDAQIEKWESKIKDSLLRRDSTLGGVISTLRDSMMGNVEYNGKNYSLSSFGITSKIYTEKGKLHIAGDSDDTLTAGDPDKLRAALQEDPQAVMNVLSELAQGMYDTLGEKMKSTKMSSAFTIYNDKQMKTDLDNYKLDLKKLEKKLNEMEDRYYKQFTAMEKAMSSLNSQSNSFASMMGLS